ncbi:bone marrow stromal antigen 2 [Peromyscus eremicus]|uniref:bone marrow stromal antigen 2 n=1 Tax=Peromyscus eremicus TaxID=42410 RepID=UPI0027DEA6CE|nr:bone marrow stromal antigen 2 [Peromyscus eremicus]
MAPTFYHYPQVPMDEKWQEQGRGLRPRCLVAAALVVLFQAALVTLLIYFAVRANSEACRDGLRAQDECRNTTHLLQRQLTRAQDGLLQAETQANTCNRTVVTLQDSLEKHVSQVREQQARIQELESKVVTLNQELEKLRTAEEASRTSQKNSASSVVVSSLLMLAVLLTLLF